MIGNKLPRVGQILVIAVILIGFTFTLNMLVKIENRLLTLEQENASMRSQIQEFLNKWDIGTVEATAYSPYDDRNGINSDGNPRTTSTGTAPGHGTIAVNPNTFPYGTRMWVAGYGWGQALDTGGAMRQNPGRIDLFKPTFKEAMKWGIRKPVVVWQKD